MTDAKLDLITKLLAKAESTTPEEAEALTEHAERLMVKYGIEQAQIDDRRAQTGEAHEQIVEAARSITGVYARDIRDLVAAVAEGLGNVRALQSKRWDGTLVVHLVGFESDVRQATILSKSLEVQAMIAMRAWWSRERRFFTGVSEAGRRRARSGFIRGFGVGAGTRIKSNRRIIVEEASAGTELVLASRLERVDASIGKTQAARPRSNADALAFNDGVREGHAANTGERAVTQGRGLSA